MYRLRNLFCYVSFAVAIAALLPASPTLGNYLAAIGAALLFFGVDVDSYREGLLRGAGLARDSVGGEQ